MLCRASGHLTSLILLLTATAALSPLASTNSLTSEPPQRPSQIDPEEHNRLGVKYLSEGNLDSAAGEFKAAAAARPKYAEALCNLGVVLGRQGKEQEAEQTFREAIQGNPQFEDAYVNLSLLLERQKRLGEARAVAARAVSIAPADPRAYTVLGSVQAKLGQLEEAAGSFRKVTQLDPLSADAHLNLGIALAEMSESQRVDLTQALAEFSQAVRLAPNSAAAHYHQGRALYNLARYAEGEPELETANKLQPGDPASLYVLALTEAQLGCIRRSDELLQQVAALDPRNAKVYYFLGRNLLREGDAAGAIAQWRKAVELDRDDGPSLYNLSLVLRRTDLPAAQAYGVRYLQLQNRHRVTKLAESARLAAEAAAQKGDWPGAIEQLSQAVAVCGDCAIQFDLRKTLGLAYCYADKLDEGERELRKVLQRHPADVDAQRGLEIIDYLKSERMGGKNQGPE